MKTKKVGAPIPVLSIRLVREDGPPGRVIRGPEDVASLAADFGLTDQPVEQCWVLHLDKRHRVVAARMVSQGTMDAALIHPREVWGGVTVDGERTAVAPIAGVIVLHNHPSGDPSPSSEDRAVTRQLAEAGRILGVPLLDHVVVAAEGWVSLQPEVSKWTP